MKKGLDNLSRNEKKVVESFVEELRNRLGNEIIKIVLFGSKIRGDFSKESDIDIFILVREKTSDIRDKVGDLTEDYIFDNDIPLSPVLYDLFEYQKNKELGSFFFENVEKEGISL
jgi:predicted nucleotidyltransferase